MVYLKDYPPNNEGTMARTNNICGFPPSIFASKFASYETALVRGPAPAGGPRLDGQALAYVPGDRWKCFKLHLRRGWAANTYWLALHHADGHWSSWPCLMGHDTVRKVLNEWNALSELRWTVESDESIEWDWPRIKHYGAKSFQPGNRVTYVTKKCITLLRRGDQGDEKVSFSLRSYPHTISPGNTLDVTAWNRVQLLSSRPYTLASLKGFTEAALKAEVEMEPEGWTALEGKKRQRFFEVMGEYFAQYTDELFASNIVLPNIDTKTPRSALKGVDVEKALDGDTEVEAMKARLAAMKAMPVEDVPALQPFEDSPEPDEDLT